MDMMPMFGATLGGGRLGVAFETIDETVATDNDLSVTDGAMVQEVVADSPAATAGLLAGDVITAVNGEPVDAERTLRDRMIAYEAGDTVTLTVLRDGESLSIDVTLDEPQYGDMRGMLEQMMPHMGGRENSFPFGDAQPVPEVTPEAEANA
jgi:S1-C subfamily serine protease